MDLIIHKVSLESMKKIDYVNLIEIFKNKIKESHGENSIKVEGNFVISNSEEIEYTYIDFQDENVEPSKLIDPNWYPLMKNSKINPTKIYGTNLKSIFIFKIKEEYYYFGFNHAANVFNDYSEKNYGIDFLNKIDITNIRKKGTFSPFSNLFKEEKYFKQNGSYYHGGVMRFLTTLACDINGNTAEENKLFKYKINSGVDKSRSRFVQGGESLLIKFNENFNGLTSKEYFKNLFLFINKIDNRNIEKYNNNLVRLKKEKVDKREKFINDLKESKSLDVIDKIWFDFGIEYINEVVGITFSHLGDNEWPISIYDLADIIKNHSQKEDEKYKKASWFLNDVKINWYEKEPKRGRDLIKYINIYDDSNENTYRFLKDNELYEIPKTHFKKITENINNLLKNKQIIGIANYGKYNLLNQGEAVKYDLNEGKINEAFVDYFNKNGIEAKNLDMKFYQEHLKKGEIADFIKKVDGDKFELTSVKKYNSTEGLVKNIVQAKQGLNILMNLKNKTFKENVSINIEDIKSINILILLKKDRDDKYFKKLTNYKYDEIKESDDDIEIKNISKINTNSLFWFELQEFYSWMSDEDKQLKIEFVIL